MLRKLREHRYIICSYNDTLPQQCVILRHDIDNDINKALKFAELEHEEGVSSTYFVLLTSDFYNAFSYKSTKSLTAIAELGHDIGLHFDEVRYPDLGVEAIQERIIKECKLLSEAIGQAVTVVSMHRPSKAILEADLKIPGLINSYGKTFFNDFKYLSDSRRRWREPVDEIVASEQYEKLHILTHAFWYNEQEKNLQDSLLSFINSGNTERFFAMRENFTKLEDEISMEQVLGGVFQ